MLKVEIIVISLHPTLKLKDSLSELSKDVNLEVNIMVATTPDQLDPKIDFSNKRVTGIEAAISLSHRNARDLALLKALDWVVILEEDAVLLRNSGALLDFIETLERKTKTDTPAVAHLAPEQFGVLWRRKRDLFYRVALIPDCAVAYALNYSALESINKSSIDLSEVADWPKAMRRMNWFAPLSPIFKHPIVDETNSSTITPRRARQVKTSILSDVISRSKLKALLLIGLSCIAKTYGDGYVEDERFRTRILTFF